MRTWFLKSSLGVTGFGFSGWHGNNKMVVGGLERAGMAISPASLWSVYLILVEDS